MAVKEHATKLKHAIQSFQEYATASRTALQSYLRQGFLFKTNDGESYLLSLALLSASIATQAAVLHVGTGQTYQRLQQAAQQARAGDTILVHSGVHSGDNAINNLHGNATQWITIMAEQQGSAVFRGGSQAFQMSEASYALKA